MKVHDAMAKNPVCCTPGDDIAAVAAVMIDYNTSVVPVTEQHFHPSRLVGVITGRDLVGKVLAQGKDPYSTDAAECVSGDVPTCGPNEEISDALVRMRESGLLRLPVVTPKGELAGVISMGDIIRHQGADSQELFKVLSVICMNDGPKRAAEEILVRPRRNSSAA
jgi:CBS domain-containing protein